MENTEQRLDDFEKILEMQFEGEDISSPMDHEWVVHLVLSPQVLLYGELLHWRVLGLEFSSIMFILNVPSALTPNPVRKR